VDHLVFELRWEVHDIARDESGPPTLADDLRGPGHRHPDLVLVVAVRTGRRPRRDHAPGPLERRVQFRPGHQPLSRHTVVRLDGGPVELADLHHHCAPRVDPASTASASGYGARRWVSRSATISSARTASTLSRESAMPCVASFTPWRWQVPVNDGGRLIR